MAQNDNDVVNNLHDNIFHNDFINVLKKMCDELKNNLTLISK
jgi:hypothetical protein